MKKSFGTEQNRTEQKKHQVYPAGYFHKYDKIRFQRRGIGHEKGVNDTERIQTVIIWKIEGKVKGIFIDDFRR